MRKVIAVAIIVMAGGFGTQAFAALTLNGTTTDLSGTNVQLKGTDTITPQSDGKTYWWAHKDGAATGDPTPALPGLDLSSYNLSRSTDAIGFTLNLNDGTNDNAITWSGNPTNGKITTARLTGSADRSGSPITITGATDITCQGIYTNGAGTGSGGAISVTQSGNFTATSILAYPANARSADSVSLTGGGPSAGWLQVTSATNAISTTGQQPANVTISGYNKVTIGAGGITTTKTGMLGTDIPAVISITNIGSGGVDATGATIRNDDTRGVNDTKPHQDLTISTTGGVTVGTLNSSVVTGGNWASHSAGQIIVTAGGDVLVTAMLDARASSSNSAHLFDAGAISVSSSGGAVDLMNLNSSNNGTGSNNANLGGNATISSYGDLIIRGTSGLGTAFIDLSAAHGAAYNGVLSLAATGGGSKITVGDEATDIFDLTKVKYASFDSAGNADYIGGIITGFNTADTGSHAGTLGDPIVPNQTLLRAPNDIPNNNSEIIYYTYVQGGLNDTLGGKVYRLADLAGTYGQGGLLVPVPEPATLAFLAIGGMAMAAAGLRRFRGA